MKKELKKLAVSDIYPFHMPGHKRQIQMQMNPYAYDITEIDGFDNLHHETGIIKELEEDFARMYQGQNAYLLVNGSTSGILSAISAATNFGDHILIARNSHKSVYHACLLKQLEVRYLYPEVSNFGINGSIRPEDVKKAFAENPDIKTVVITSPTYDGVFSDIEKIAKIVHDNGASLIVDSAHGAHYGNNPLFPQNNAVQHADCTIVSLHKTLPSVTQTALLLHQGDRISKDSLKNYLGIYQTSSPSYLFMMSMENCLDYLKEGLDWDGYKQNLEEFYDTVKSLKFLHVISGEDAKNDDTIYEKDPTKILIVTNVEGYSGEELMENLRNPYSIECEMAAVNYVCALSSVMDTKEGFRRLASALLSIDEELAKKGCKKEASEVHTHSFIYGKRTAALPLGKAMDLANLKEYEEIRFEDIKQGDELVSLEFVYLYPPGIPILCPGEVIPSGLSEKLEILRGLNYQVEGLADTSAQRIKVLKR